MPGDNWTEEIWTHDLRLWMPVEVPQQSTSSVGRHVDMSIGTSGPSKLDAPIFLPPAPIALGVDDAPAVSVAHEDFDADRATSDRCGIAGEAAKRAATFVRRNVPKPERDFHDASTLLISAPPPCRDSPKCPRGRTRM